MALLFEIADYSLDQLISIPEEKACTSMDRRWAVPSANSSAKQPVMGAAVPKNLNSKKTLAVHCIIRKCQELILAIVSQIVWKF